MADSTQRKTYFILALAFSLVLAAVAVISDEEMREKLGSTYYVFGFVIIGCVALVLSGYIGDRTMMLRLKSLRTSVPVESAGDDDAEGKEPDHDEIIGLARNIERMAQALQKTEASYRGIVEDQVDLICRYRLDGKLTFVNSAYAAAFGRKRPELVGQPFPLFVSGAAIGDEPYTFERELDYPDSRKRWFMWTQRPIKDDRGETLEFQGVGHDITLRKEAEAALLHAKDAAEAADRAKSEFLAIVSHECYVKCFLWEGSFKNHGSKGTGVTIFHGFFICNKFVDHAQLFSNKPKYRVAPKYNQDNINKHFIPTVLFLNMCYFMFKYFVTARAVHVNLVVPKYKIKKRKWCPFCSVRIYDLKIFEINLFILF